MAQTEGYTCACLECGRGLLQIWTTARQKNTPPTELPSIHEDQELVGLYEFCWKASSLVPTTVLHRQPHHEPLHEIPDNSEAEMPTAAASFFFIGTPIKEEPETFYLHGRDTPTPLRSNATGRSMMDQTPTVSTASEAKGSTESSEQSPPSGMTPQRPPEVLFSGDREHVDRSAASAEVAGCIASMTPEVNAVSPGLADIGAGISVGAPLPPWWAHHADPTSPTDSLNKAADASVGSSARAARHANSRHDPTSPLTPSAMDIGLASCTSSSELLPPGCTGIPSGGRETQSSSSQLCPQPFVTLDSLPPGGLQAFMMPALPPGSPPPMAAFPPSSKNTLPSFEVPSVLPPQTEAPPLAIPWVPEKGAAFPRFPKPQTQPQACSNFTLNLTSDNFEQICKNCGFHKNKHLVNDRPRRNRHATNDLSQKRAQFEAKACSSFKLNQTDEGGAQICKDCGFHKNKHAVNDKPRRIFTGAATDLSQKRAQFEAKAKEAIKTPISSPGQHSHGFFTPTGMERKDVFYTPMRATPQNGVRTTPRSDLQQTSMRTTPRSELPQSGVRITPRSDLPQSSKRTTSRNDLSVVAVAVGGTPRSKLHAIATPMEAQSVRGTPASTYRQVL